MADHFNKLTPAEAERLAMLAEECAEVIQIAMKIMRHGYNSYHPDNPRVTNRELLRGEVTDLGAALGFIWNDIGGTPSVDEIRTATRKKRRFSHHQEDTPT